MFSYMLCSVYPKKTHKNKKKAIVFLNFNRINILQNNCQCIKSYPRNIEDILVQNLKCLELSSETWKLQGIVLALLFAPVTKSK